MSTEATVRASRSHIQLYAFDDQSPVRWRVLSGNNRELGRGSGEFADRESCVLGIKHLQNVITQLDVGIRRAPTGATWVWELSLGGVSVANSGHSYDRLIRCRQSFAHFVAQLIVCEVRGGLMLTHSRRRGAPVMPLRHHLRPRGQRRQ